MAKEFELGGYTVMVFKNLEDNSFCHSYVMTICFPNWESRIPELGEVGYLSYEYVQAGIDKYWNGETFIPYNYSNFIFYKFVIETPDNFKEKIII